MQIPKFFADFTAHYQWQDNFPSAENYEKMKKVIGLRKGESAAPLGFNKNRKMKIQKKYCLETVNGEELLLCKTTKRRVMHHSEFLDVMKKFHTESGHPGRDVTHRRLQEIYVCVPRQLIVLFIKNCAHCKKKRSILQIVQSEFDGSENISAGPLDFETNEDVDDRMESKSFQSHDDLMNLIVCPCHNCSNIVGDKQKLSKITFEDEFNSINTEVQVWDAIAYIYGISPNDFQTFSKKYPGNSKFPSKNKGMDMAAVTLCDTCIPLLTENYRVHRKFNDMSNASSVIQKFVQFCKQKPKATKRKSKASRAQDISFSSSADNKTENPDYVDDLFEDFNFEDDGHEPGSPQDNSFTEQKHEPINEPKHATTEIFPTSEPGPRITRGSLKARAFVKLEKLSEEDYRNIKDTQRNDAYSSEGENNDSDSDYRPEEEEEDESSLKRKSVNVRDINRKSKNMKLSEEPDPIGNEHSTSDNTSEQTEQDKILDSGEKSEPKPGKGRKKTSASVNKDKVYKCDICEKTYSNRHSFRKHRGTHNDNPCYYTCKICGQTYKQSSYRAFRDHVLSHSGVKRFECTTCDEKFQTRSQLEVHKKTHITECNFSCEECGKSFKLFSQLYGHKMIHVNEEHVCEDCGRIFKSKEYLKKHRKRVHSGEKYICEECGSSFSQKYGLFLHVKRLHKHELVFKCEICGKHLSSEVRLKTHMWSQHTGEKPLVCKFEGCDARYGNQDAFDAHVRSHSGIKFECTVCGKKFDRKQYLKWHFRTHTGEKPKKRIPKVKTGSESQFRADETLALADFSNRPNDNLALANFSNRPNETLALGLMGNLTNLSAPVSNLEFIGNQ